MAEPHSQKRLQNYKLSPNYTSLQIKINIFFCSMAELHYLCGRKTVDFAISIAHEAASQPAVLASRPATEGPRL